MYFHSYLPLSFFTLLSICVLQRVIKETSEQSPDKQKNSEAVRELELENVKEERAETNSLEHKHEEQVKSHHHTYPHPTGCYWCNVQFFQPPGQLCVSSSSIHLLPVHPRHGGRFVSHPTESSGASGLYQEAGRSVCALEGGGWGPLRASHGQLQVRITKLCYCSKEGRQVC